MWTSAIVATSINLKPQELYSVNQNEIIREKINAIYLNKCNKEMLVKEVEVLTQTHFIINPIDIKAEGHCDLTLKLKGIVLPNGYVLHGCQISVITPEDFISATHEYAVINITESNKQIKASIGMGMTVPIVIEGSRYNIDSDKIVCIGRLFYHISQPTVYYNFSSPMNKEELGKIRDVLKIIKDEEAKHDKFKTLPQYKSFVKLMYPYLNDRLFTETKLYKSLGLVPIEFDIEALGNLKTGTICYPQQDKRESARFFHSNKKINILDIESKDDRNTLVENNLFAIITNILNTYFRYLVCLRGFIETYKDVDDLRKIQTYVAAITKTKQI